MRAHLRVLFVAAFATIALVPAIGVTAAPAQEASPTPSPGEETTVASVPAAGGIFDEGTTPEYARQFLDELDAARPPGCAVLGALEPGSTALNNGGGAQGDVAGADLEHHPRRHAHAGAGRPDTTCNSNLIATFNSVYGAGNWQAEIQRVWNDWTALTGNVYTTAVTPTPTAPRSTTGRPGADGSARLANVRGDIRIGGCTIDGNSRRERSPTTSSPTTPCATAT